MVAIERYEAAIVAFFAGAPDYEFVIWLSGGDDFRFPEFIPRQADKPSSSKCHRQPPPLTHERPIMKTSTLVAALSLSFVATGAALANGEATYEKPQVIQSQVSRADVIAQLNQARADGTLLVSEGDYQKNAPFTSQRRRGDPDAVADARRRRFDLDGRGCGAADAAALCGSRCARDHS